MSHSEKVARILSAWGITSKVDKVVEKSIWDLCLVNAYGIPDVQLWQAKAGAASTFDAPLAAAGISKAVWIGYCRLQLDI